MCSIPACVCTLAYRGDACDAAAVWKYGRGTIPEALVSDDARTRLSTARGAAGGMFQ